MSDEPVDLPLLDPALQALPTDILNALADRARNDLWVFATGVLGYTDLSPSAHGPLCRFLDRHPSRFKMVQMPRGHLKTSIGTIARVTQMVTRNPNARILLANETSTNAERFLSAIKQHVESNRRFRTLFSKIIPKELRKGWSNESLTFVRDWLGPEPTIDTIGMTGAMTSRHFTHITIDDPISEEAAKSEAVMTDVITRIDKIISMMVNPEVDTFDLIGTRWAFHDVYSHFEKLYGDGLARFIRGALEDGKPIWPERFSMETLAQARTNMGDYAFSCLYLNNPRNESVQDFNIRDLRWFRWGSGSQRVVLYEPDGSIRAVWDQKQLDITLTVDLAVAEKTSSDRNAIVVVGSAPSGDLVVLEAWGERCPPSRVMDVIFEFAERYRPRIVGVESVAYQKSFKYFLEAEAKRRGQWLHIEPLGASRAKETRIRGLQPIAAMGRLYMLGTQHLLRQEMAEFPLGKHDDVLDALAMQLQLLRGRLSPGFLSKYKASEAAFLRDIDGYGLRQRGPDPDSDIDFDRGDTTYREVLLET